MLGLQASKQASKFIRQKQYYDNINTKRVRLGLRLSGGRDDQGLSKCVFKLGF